ncbi:hypothetical protein Back11_63600 [Paenibacillus baekrokdamisoli]|uniref:Uncharacterized protein n=1 Tax=Paenibacillus baekrokdamisoli TaxID=1712516 RepID=A0A3G9J9H8_9BACL|nr:HAD hydrolase-like protein [Paenibacillus baekrokdamisoli]MBB3069411.1 phosphoglycolate phosphatase-like HAD superfamily hydrolase [Paenibacillus baekrokdamisoli]BBH25015.1 hypothetical protein Back11_63600 [Paenibacillus baekrokdamisoli]
MPVLYMDLDGTILDVWQRYYCLMKDFFESKLDNPFPELQQYQQLKMTLIEDATIIHHLYQNRNFSKNDVLSEFRLYKQGALESERMLRKDTLIGQLHQFKAQLKSEYKLHLLSIRRNKNLAMQQLQYLNIMELFDQIDFVLPTREYNPKWFAIKNKVSRDDCIIGDSEIDIACGTMLGLRTFHVSTGLRSYEYAAQLGQAIRLNNYSEVHAYL